MPLLLLLLLLQLPLDANIQGTLLAGQQP